MATAGWDNTVKVWDVATGTEVASLRGHSGAVMGVAFSPDGKRLASTSGYRVNGELKIWDTAPWRQTPDP